MKRAALLLALLLLAGCQSITGPTVGHRAAAPFIVQSDPLPPAPADELAFKKTVLTPAPDSLIWRIVTDQAAGFGFDLDHEWILQLFINADAQGTGYLGVYDLILSYDGVLHDWSQGGGPAGWGAPIGQASAAAHGHELALSIARADLGALAAGARWHLEIYDGQGGARLGEFDGVFRGRQELLAMRKE